MGHFIEDRMGLKVPKRMMRSSETTQQGGLHHSGVEAGAEGVEDKPPF